MISNELLKRRILDMAIHGKLVENDLSLKPVAVEAITKDIPFEIPTNWKWVELEQCVDFNVGKTPPTKDSSYWGEDVKWVSISDMKHRKYVDSTSRSISNKAYLQTFNRKMVPIGTLLMSFKLTIGRLSITNIECVHNEAIVSLYPKDYLLRDYLLNALDGLDLEKNVKNAIKGKTLNSKSIAKITIPIPPIEEQKRIVDKIQELFELIDRKDKNDQEKSNLKDILKKKVLDRAIHGTLITNDISLEPIDVEAITENIPFDIPSNWKWTKTCNIFDVRGGKRIPKGEKFLDEGCHIYIRVSDMNDMSISTSNLKYISDEVYNKIKKYIITKDDLYITVAGTIGQVGTVPRELDGMNLTENANRLIPLKVDKEFYKYMFNSCFMQDSIKNNTTKAAQPKLAIKRINELIVPVPPLEEQYRIVEKIEQCFDLVDQL